MFLNSGVLVPQFSETPLLGSLAQETEDLQCVVVRGTFLRGCCVLCHSWSLTLNPKPEAVVFPQRVQVPK